ncbi:MAG: glutamine-hydrolyzing GMP synthase, partial [Pseudobdellovibrionaceae bacterium]
TPIELVQKWLPYGVILSGGPNSVYAKDAPTYDVSALLKSHPVLGICYGMQLMAQQLGGAVEAATHREYGLQTLNWQDSAGSTSHSGGARAQSDLFSVKKVWMSHGDIVTEAPAGFQVAAVSETGHAAALVADRAMAVQFHPEVAHTENGIQVLKHFSENICHAPAEWKMDFIFQQIEENILSAVSPQDHVLVGLSGGVDSSVVATLLTKILGAERVHCVFVDNGLLRKDEFSSVLAAYKAIGLNVLGVDARKEFMTALAGISDPEQKRKTIGRVFIEIFDKSYDKSLPIRWLAQGTLYPDVIESVSSVGGSVTIKSHHNVGGLPEKMNLKLLEPVRELFKDEVRRLGEQLGLPKDILWRHPFPGPGLAIRVLGEITEEKLTILRDCDAIFIDELKKQNLYDKIWQAFCVLLPVRTVGVQGDSRTYSHVLALRSVTASDGMTADWYNFEFSFLQKVSNRITNSVSGVNRVVYDITSKPPATIEWE